MFLLQLSIFLFITSFIDSARLYYETRQVSHCSVCIRTEQQRSVSQKGYGFSLRLHIQTGLGSTYKTHTQGSFVRSKEARAWL
jgi:hypothetical protein